MGHSGAGGKLIHKKTRSKKSRDTVPLSDFLRILQTRIVRAIGETCHATRVGS
jgi:hypothetical protein